MTSFCEHWSNCRVQVKQDGFCPCFPPLALTEPPTRVVDAPLPRRSGAGGFTTAAFAALDDLCAELDALHAENGALRHDLDAARSERDTAKAKLSQRGW